MRLFSALTCRLEAQRSPAPASSLALAAVHRHRGACPTASAGCLLSAAVRISLAVIVKNPTSSQLSQGHLYFSLHVRAPQGAAPASWSLRGPLSHRAPAAWPRPWQIRCPGRRCPGKPRWQREGRGSRPHLDRWPGCVLDTGPGTTGAPRREGHHSGDARSGGREAPACIAALQTHPLRTPRPQPHPALPAPTPGFHAEPTGRWRHKGGSGLSRLSAVPGSRFPGDFLVPSLHTKCLRPGPTCRTLAGVGGHVTPRGHCGLTETSPKTRAPQAKLHL